MRKLHMGTMSYGADSMDEVAHQLELAFGASGDNSERSDAFVLAFHTQLYLSAALMRQATLSTGIQLSRGRRDMSSRVKDVVLSLALCHNVCLSSLFRRRVSHYYR